jgi:glycosyltransferase involved in cell wall biosynthesis
MPSTQISDLKLQIFKNSPKRIWIVNPFDQLPNETDVPLRYWALCRTFAEQGHDVVWWSSDFSHLTKSKRSACPDTDGFSVRLVETPPYTKNISFARLKNHKAFAKGFYRDAMAGLTSGELKAPDRIVVSLPPLGIAEAAFSIREYLQKTAVRSQKSEDGRSWVASAPDPHATAKTENWALKQPSYAHQSSQRSCQVVVDIMDAWPETFYQALPKPLRKILGPVLLAPMHRSAKRAYQGADKISAVGQSYLDLAANYLGHQSSAITDQSSSAKPMHLCYHGTDLARFKRKRSRVASAPDSGTPHAAPNKQQTTNNKQPLKAVYLGSMGSGYDLETIIEVAARWKTENIFPFQIHFAGDGPQREALEARCAALGLLADETSGCQELGTKNQEQTTNNKQHSPFNAARSAVPRVVFHGFLKKDAINELLLTSDLALVPNRPDSLVACPYKAGEYAAAGLPILSCLGGELNDLLKQWNAGSEYNEGDVESLHAAFEKYSDLGLLKQQSLNARKMAETLFDRKRSYAELAAFILGNDSPDTQ